MNTFLGSIIKPIKEIKLNTNNDTNTNTNINNDFIIVTTCYFHDTYYNFYDRNYEYLTGLIDNIETFNMKVKQFTTNSEKWIYRVYIDEFVLNIKSTMDEIMNGNLKKKTKIHKTLNNYIDEIDDNIQLIKNNINYNYNIFLFIQLLLTKYFKLITESTDNKYKNIEIFTYNNDNTKYKLYSNPKINVSGEIATYGTLLRYHSLLDSKASVVIMRNCSHNMTPLDIIIQNYWIENSDKEFMEYVDTDYNFINRGGHNYKYYWYNKLYNKNTNDKETRSKKIKHFNYDRIMAGLFSCKIGNSTNGNSTNGNSTNNTSKNYNSHKYYKDIFNELNYKLVESKIFIHNNHDNHINVNVKHSSIIKFGYGVDEAIIQFIFPKLRTVSYINKFKKTNPDNIVQHTFAINFVNGGKIHNCNKCDKKTKIQLNIIKIKKTKKKTKNNTDNLVASNNDTKDKNSKDDKEKSNCNIKTLVNCRLYDIYKDDYNEYSMPYDIVYNLQFNYTYDIKYLRSLQFVTLNENTWEIQKLPMELLISSIMFKNKYTFALKTYRIDNSKYMPYFITDDRLIKDKTKNTQKNDTTKNDTTKNDTTKNDTTINKKQKKYDPYLILCSFRKKHLDVDKFLENLPIAYNENNFYPVVMYPRYFTILNYKKKNDIILFKKMLEPIHNKHKLKLQ